MSQRPSPAVCLLLSPRHGMDMARVGILKMPKQLGCEPRQQCVPLPGQRGARLLVSSQGTLTCLWCRERLAESLAHAFAEVGADVARESARGAGESGAVPTDLTCLSCNDTLRAAASRKRALYSARMDSMGHSPLLGFQGRR
jgi:hypothetical protein